MTSVASGDRCRFRPPDVGAVVVWEVTDYCNLSCTHCCTDSGPERDRTYELDADTMRQAASDMVRAGVTEFYFSGGEPFVRLDLLDLIASIDPSTVEVYCNTNGYYVDEKVAARLANTAMRRVTVSIDGHTRGIHALVRGKATSYDRAVNAVRVLLASGVPVRVSHVIHPGNLDHVEGFCETMAGLGVSAMVLNTVFPAGRAARFPALALDSSQMASLAPRLDDLATSYGARGVSIDHSVGKPPTSDIEGCPAGRTVFYVAANGDVSTCSWLYKIDPGRFTLGNLAQASFASLHATAEENLRGVRALATHCPLPMLDR